MLNSCILLLNVHLKETHPNVQAFLLLSSKSRAKVKVQFALIGLSSWPSSSAPGKNLYFDYILTTLWSTFDFAQLFFDYSLITLQQLYSQTSPQITLRTILWLSSLILKLCRRLPWIFKSKPIIRKWLEINRMSPGKTRIDWSSLLEVLILGNKQVQGLGRRDLLYNLWKLSLAPHRIWYKCDYLLPTFTKYPA